MANHCLNGTCASCGADYCLKGCNYDTGPDAKHATKARQAAAGEKPLEGETCRYCNKPTIYTHLTINN